VKLSICAWLVKITVSSVQELVKLGEVGFCCFCILVLTGLNMGLARWAVNVVLKASSKQVPMAIDTLFIPRIRDLTGSKGYF
jgi:hypothetical protein